LLGAIYALELVIDRQFDWDDHIPGRMLDIMHYKMEKFDAMKWHNGELGILQWSWASVARAKQEEQEDKKTEEAYWKKRRGKQVLNEDKRAELDMYNFPGIRQIYKEYAMAKSQPDPTVRLAQDGEDMEDLDEKI